MRLLFLSLIISFVSSHSCAQNEEYVITFRNDTIFGKISIVNFKQQQVIVKRGKEKNLFEVYQVRNIQTKKGTFRPLKISGNYQFALLMKSGFLSYYKFSEDPNAPSPSFDTPLLVKLSGEQLVVPNIKFKALTSRFLEDCNDIKQNFDSKKYNRNKLILLVDDYNNCMGNRTEPVKQNQDVKSKMISKTDQLNKLKGNVELSSRITNKTELVEMLADVESKVKEGKNLPSYLLRIIKESLSTDQVLLMQFESFIE